MKLFLQKNAKFSSAGDPRAPGGWVLRPLTPSLRRLGASTPDPHWPSAAGGSAPRPSKKPPHCEFLATHLITAADRFFNRLYGPHAKRAEKRCQPYASLFSDKNAKFLK